MDKPKIGGSGYNYSENLLNHLESQGINDILSDNFYWPRQLEIHLPSNHKINCNLNCQWCQGRFNTKDLGNWELDGLELLEKVKGNIPYHIYGGNYTEPLLNPYFLSCLSVTKKYNNNFGIHPNGTKLLVLEKNLGFITELNRLANSSEDYISISLDSGLPWTWGKVKSASPQLFHDIIDGIRLLCNKREQSNKKYAIRVCYLMTPDNSSEGNILGVMGIMKDLGVDSIRFSIPYAHYLQDFDLLKNYKEKVEDKYQEDFKNKIVPYLSDKKPFVFYVGSEETNVENYTFDRCFYHAYQITLGADGWFYKCSSVSSPDALNCRLGKMTSNLDYFKDCITLNKTQNKTWDCKKGCFDNGLRCNRMAIEINKRYNEKP